VGPRFAPARLRLALSYYRKRVWGQGNTGKGAQVAVPYPLSPDIHPIVKAFCAFYPQEWSQL